eukprot:Seg3467.1 transcript_id=Seg3467.1/GoldUCD/mRNA.D3Y31 product="Mitochondrial intermembrane space import and assembly protein 40" protein_id=Seg3467.1/GoldUCD/D3Y31
MPVCFILGKDKIVFVSKEEYSEPPKEKLQYDKEDEEQMGLIKPDGDINWNCPCLQGMADGPCGTEFRESFSCFHYSEADPKGSDCIDQFKEMQECFMKYPEIYAPEDEKEIANAEVDNEQKSIEDEGSSVAGQSSNVEGVSSAQKTDTSEDISNQETEVPESKIVQEIEESQS